MRSLHLATAVALIAKLASAEVAEEQFELPVSLGDPSVLESLATDVDPQIQLTGAYCGCADGGPACGCTTPCCGSALSGGCCCDPFVPYMIGDALAMPITAISDQGSQFFYRPVVRPSTNNSPFARDRFSVDYRVFGDTMVFEDPLAPTVGGDRTDHMDLLVIRGEKALLDNAMSVEFIAPFLVGPAAENFTADGEPNEGAEFGDLTLGLKAVLYQRGSTAFTAGLQVEAPTAQSLDKPNGGVFGFDYSVSHNAWHFTPYLAAATTMDRAFVQSFVSYRMATEAETVTDPTDGAFVHSLRDPDALMVDIGLGYWCYQGGRCDLIRGIAPVVEVNYFSSQEDHQHISVGNPTLLNRGFGTVDYLTLTTGIVTQFRNNDTLTLAVGIPLRDSFAFIPPVIHQGHTDSYYDLSLSVQYNHLRW